MTSDMYVVFKHPHLDCQLTSRCDDKDDGSIASLQVGLLYKDASRRD